MLGKAAERIIRTKWKSVQQFAEELYAIFTADLPLSHEGPIDLTPDNGGPAININLPDDGTDSPAITITRGDTVTTIGGNGGGGGPDLTPIDWPDGGGTEAIPDPRDNPITMYGEVQAKLGPSLYSVKVWAKDPLTSPHIATLQVRQALIDPDDEIPAGTPALVVVFFSGSSITRAVMQVPVFLAPGV